MPNLEGYKSLIVCEHTNLQVNETDILQAKRSKIFVELPDIRRDRGPDSEAVGISSDLLVSLQFHKFFNFKPCLPAGRLKL
jgi:hypothetical protein